MRPDCSGSSRRPRSRSKRRGSRRWRRASSPRRSGFPTPRPRRCSASRPPFRATAKGWTLCSPPAKACRRGLRRSTRWLLVYIHAVRLRMSGRRRPSAHAKDRDMMDRKLLLGGLAAMLAAPLSGCYQPAAYGVVTPAPVVGYGYGYGAPAYSYGYGAPAYSYGYGYGGPAYGYGYRYGGYGWRGGYYHGGAYRRGAYYHRGYHGGAWRR